MSSFDRGSGANRRFGGGVLLAAAAALALGACSVQPLYGPSNFVDSGPVQSTLTRISVGEVNDRVGQQVRNRVIFQMTGGKAISDPLYHMTLTVTSREIGLGITVTEASPVYSIIVQATFTVKRAGTEEVLVTGTAKRQRVLQLRQPDLRQYPRQDRRRETVPPSRSATRSRFASPRLSPREAEGAARAVVEVKTDIDRVLGAERRLRPAAPHSRQRHRPGRGARRGLHRFGAWRFGRSARPDPARCVGGCRRPGAPRRRGLCHSDVRRAGAASSSASRATGRWCRRIEPLIAVAAGGFVPGRHRRRASQDLARPEAVRAGEERLRHRLLCRRRQGPRPHRRRGDEARRPRHRRPTPARR